MSGNRSLHRQLISSSQGTTDNATTAPPIWQVQTLVEKNHWMIWTASADGTLSGMKVIEKSASNQDLLDASAMTLESKYALKTNSLMGCTQLSLKRNYVGDDDMAGDVIVACLDLSGCVRVWNVSGETNNNKPLHKFVVDNSTGTTLALLQPKLFVSNVMVAAVGCMDGSVSIVSTGVEVPTRTAAQSSSSSKSSLEAGTVLEKWGSSGGAAIATRLVWHPMTPQLLAVGREDGVVDLFLNGKKWHSFLRHEDAVRGVAFSPDGQLLITGCNDGMICIWDYNRRALVHHVMQAHASWILDVICLEDSRRFVSCGSDGMIHLWSVSSQAPLHSFSTTKGDTPWTIHANDRDHRLVAGTEHGWLQVFSIE